MLKEILSISGRPGLYKLLSQGKNMLIVESLTDKKRFPVYMTEKVVALGDVAMYTDDVEVPLGEVMDNIYAKHNGAVDINVKKASGDELRAFMAEALPNYDRDDVDIQIDGLDEPVRLFRCRRCHLSLRRQRSCLHQSMAGDKTDDDRHKLPPLAEKSCLSRCLKYIQKFCLYIQNFCLYKQNF